jgi:hypothetical protein
MPKFKQYKPQKLVLMSCGHLSQKTATLSRPRDSGRRLLDWCESSPIKWFDHETIRIWDLNCHELISTRCASRPYEGLNIWGVEGLSKAQRDGLMALGAIEIAPQALLA